ncbi:MAG: hypothetical protein P9L94_11770 [Candidatus Hinthialibacter antarcticus]|nr:hypothetical protein [Candidatus Hinthialibacter antarcticus]
MWIFTSNAFLSIVVHKNDPSIRLVRGRCNGDIEAVFPDANVFEDVAADYRYRAVIPVDDVACVLAKHVLEMDYTNFKNSIPNEKHDYHNACLQVWQTMHGLQASAR